jgi:hypothetical protein
MIFEEFWILRSIIGTFIFKFIQTMTSPLEITKMYTKTGLTKTFESAFAPKLVDINRYTSVRIL